MAIADVNIANKALLILGLTPLASMSDVNPKSQAINNAYMTSARAELRAHVWSFAKKRAQLAASSTVPAFGYDAQFPFPVDCLRMVYVGDVFVGNASMNDYQNVSTAEFCIEGRAILSSQAGTTGTLNVTYIADVTGDPNLYDATFCEALAARLARDCCTALTESNTKKTDAKEAYRDAIAEAVHCNAIEKAPEGLPDNSWILARL